MKQRHKALIFLLIVAYVIGMCFCSCSPGKKLLKEQETLQQLAANQAAHDKTVAADAVDDFTKNNPCPAGPSINLDSLCSIYYQCPDAGLNATAGDYTAGDSSIQAPVRNAPKTVLVPYEDLRRINLLMDSCREKDKRLAVADAQLKLIVAAGEAAATEKLKNTRLLMWVFLAVAIALMIGIIIIAKR